MIGTRLHIEVTDTETQTLQEHDLEPAESPIWLGRDRSCRVVLAGASVSRRHCRIESRDDGWAAVDSSSLGSTKNGMPISKDDPDPIQNGDVIVCANFEIRIAILPVTDPTLRPDPQALRRLMAEVEETPVVPPAVWLFTEGQVKTFELAEDGASLAIGRSAECQIRLADPLRVVSALHARIERNWAGVFVYDTSRNGIYVNGVRVEEHRPLQHGDRITIAVEEEDAERPLLVFSSDGSTEAPEGPRSSPSPLSSAAASAAAASPSAPDIQVSRAGEGSDQAIPIRPAAPEPAANDFAVSRDRPAAAPASRATTLQPPAKPKSGLLSSARSNMLFVLVLVVSGLALLTILVWGIVLLRG